MAGLAPSRPQAPAGTPRLGNSWSRPPAPAPGAPARGSRPASPPSPCFVAHRGGLKACQRGARGGLPRPGQPSPCPGVETAMADPLFSLLCHGRFPLLPSPHLVLCFFQGGRRQKKPFPGACVVRDWRKGAATLDPTFFHPMWLCPMWPFVWLRFDLPNRATSPIIRKILFIQYMLCYKYVLDHSSYANSITTSSAY
jgi:hypothetical protein